MAHLANWGTGRNACATERQSLDVVGYFFQVGYEALHFFVAGGFVWGAENRGRVHCGHHVRS